MLTSANWLGEGYDGYTLPMLLTIGLYLAAIALEARFFWAQRHVGMQGTTGPGSVQAEDGTASP